MTTGLAPGSLVARLRCAAPAPTMLRALLLLPFLLLPFLLPAAAAPAQDEGRALASFKRAFATAKGKRVGAGIEEKRAALQGLAGYDSGKVAEELVDGWENLAAELAAIDAQRAEYAEEMAKLIEGQEASSNRTLPQAAFDRFNQLKPLIAELRDRGDALRELQLDVAARIAGLRRRDGVLWLLKRVCGDKKAELPLRLAAAKAVGASAGEVLDELAAALARARQPAEQIVLLDAIALAGEPAKAHATPVLELLGNKEPAVAERAALALAKLAVPEAVGPMIDLLARSSGQMRLRVVAALEVLTGEQFGDNVGAWQAWFQAEGAALAAGGRELGKGVPSNRKTTNENYYFGIPQEQSDAILYVIDCSDSMKAPVRLDTGVTTAGGVVKEMTRLEACQVELIRALGKLRPTQKFAILWYNDLPHWWEPKMQLATKQTVEKAQDFVASLKHASSTNIHDSLELGFSLVGRGAHDKYYGVELDTIFLLTDGSPTRPDGSLDSTEKILVGVRAWNPLKRVTIHCIAIGKDLNAPFLRQLASENGGEFKQF